MTTDEKYMKQAIKQAKKAYAIDEVPIGCIIVRDEDGKVIAVDITAGIRIKYTVPCGAECNSQGKQKTG